MGSSLWTAETPRPEGASGASREAAGTNAQRAPAWVRLLVPACLAIYFLIGYARIRTTDWVPFSAWALFVFVPNHPSVYAVKILSSGDRTFDPPLDFDRTEGVIAHPHDIVSVYVINKFGAALEKGDAAAAARYRALLEGNALPEGMGWELVRRSYDPLVRWEMGSVEDTVLARYLSGGRRD